MTRYCVFNAPKRPRRPILLYETPCWHRVVFVRLFRARIKRNSLVHESTVLLRSTMGCPYCLKSDRHVLRKRTKSKKNCWCSKCINNVSRRTNIYMEKLIWKNITSKTRAVLFTYNRKIYFSKVDFLL